jgi:molybdenum cofactor biosynthesis protein MoaC
MRDISHKTCTLRHATARAELHLKPETVARLRAGDLPKSDPLPVARVAAIQAVKNTSQIIPYCHPLPVDFVGVEFTVDDARIEAVVTVKAIYKTGVEMEALTGAAVAALTLYDMLKIIDETMRIGAVELVEKRGGKSDYRSGLAAPARAAVLVMSDRVAAGERRDVSGEIIGLRLEEAGFEVVETRVIPDDLEQIAECLAGYADGGEIDLVLTTGGTGLGPRDVTPEAMARVIEREAPGIAEAARAYGQDRTPYAMLSRGRAGVRGRTLIVNLPGSRGGVEESLDAIMPGLVHALKMIRGGDHPEKPSETQGGEA